MWEEDITAATAETSALMGERLGLRGATLAQRVARAGRMLPRRIRRDARYLAEAEGMASHPRLARLVDPDRFDAAQGALAAYLTTIDPSERRMTRIIGITAVIVFDLLVIALLVVVVLRWRGFV